MKKYGHAGTLDPLATGVLPILVGKGTLLSKYLTNHDKTYEVTLKLGAKTDSADSDGNIIETQNINKEILDSNHVKKALKSFVGKQLQTPPMYSAIRVNGKRLYEYARKGKTVKVEPREIEIYKIDLIKIDVNTNQIYFRVSCSKGTYVRSLCEDIAVKLGTIGYMTGLKRTQVGNFNINDSVTVDELEENLQNQEFMETHFISIEKMFKDKSSIKLDEANLKKFLNGVMLKFNFKNDVYKIYTSNGKFIGTGIITDRKLKRDIVLDFD